MNMTTQLYWAAIMDIIRRRSTFTASYLCDATPSFEGGSLVLRFSDSEIKQLVDNEKTRDLILRAMVDVSFMQPKVVMLCTKQEEEHFL